MQTPSQESRCTIRSLLRSVSDAKAGAGTTDMHCDKFITAALYHESPRDGNPIFLPPQKGIEQAIEQTLGSEDRVLLTHRGTLDPLAFCLANGWTEERFWRVTGVRLEDEYQRYHGVIHMVSTAVGAAQFYRYRPEEHRPETPQEAAVLDEHLTRIWSRHPRYIRIPNDTLDWPTKSRQARAALLQLIS